MKTIFYLIIICFASLAEAQNTFKVKSSDTDESLIGATAIVKSANGSKDQLISDIDGNFETSIQLPFDVEVRFLGFETLSTRIWESGQIIKLQPSPTSLDQVVVTGQFSPQSARNSVYKVRSITSDRIASQNANSIYDVLSNELNVRISRDNATGRSGISLQGLSGQYVKVLIDGVPAVGKGGVRNDIDLGQFDIQNIDRIEVVQGPMAVNYGADALAGVINIITKKGIQSKIEVGVNLQTETAGDEYSLFDQGIHSPSVTVGYKINDRWFTQLSGRHYRFGGWINEQFAEVPGEFDWHPKTQWFGGWLTRYSTDQWEIYYRLDVMDEVITNKGDLITPDNGEPYTFDEDYNADRYIHQIQSDWVFGDKASLNSVVSYTDYKRLSSNFRRFPISGVELPLTVGNDTIFYRSFFTRHTLNNLFSTGKRSFQVGVEGTRETAGGSTLNDGNKHLTDIAGFVSAEFVFNQLKVRPGVRYSYNSLFSTIPTPSINFAFSATDNTQLRWSYGRGFRAPSIRELFHEFIDSNHNLIGNPDLDPENSHNFNFDVTHELSRLPVSLNLNTFYNEINNGITVLTPEGNEATTYFNLTKYKSIGGNLWGTYKQGGLNGSVGFSYIGRYQALRNEAGVPDFVFSPELMGRVQYQFSDVGLTLSTFYKYTGAFKQYRIVDEAPALVGQDDFHTLDANLSKTFGSFLRLGFGIRNALDVTTVNSNAVGGVHGGGSDVPVGFGRSYFLTLNYQFKK